MEPTDVTKSPTGGSAPPAGTGGARKWVAVLAIVLLVGNAVLGILYWRALSAEQEARDSAAAGEQALELAALRASAADAAAEFARILGTYRFDTLDADFARVAEVATDEFESEYREVGDQLRAVLAEGQGVSRGVVNHAAVESLSAEEATVLVFLDQEIVNNVIPDGRVDASRLVLTLQREGDRWLLHRVDLGS